MNRQQQTALPRHMSDKTQMIWTGLPNTPGRCIQDGWIIGALRPKTQHLRANRNLPKKPMPNSNALGNRRGWRRACLLDVLYCKVNAKPTEIPRIGSGPRQP